MQMVTFKIDNRTAEVPAGTTILEAASKLGIAIPTLCYFKEFFEINVGKRDVKVVVPRYEAAVPYRSNTGAADGEVAPRREQRLDEKRGVLPPPERREAEVRAFQNTSEEREGRFLHVQDVMETPEYREIVLRKAFGELATFRRKYSDLSELSKIISAIDDVITSVM